MKWQGLIILAINITSLEPYQAPEKFPTKITSFLLEADKKTFGRLGT